MNRFRKNKKGKNEVEAAETPHLFSSSLKSVKKKKSVEDEKPFLDLSHALPSDDDFRTSLIMPKLSARFSMLREQDDPSTKIGKASDDSVLFPKRASRLNLLGQAPTSLADIDEVSTDGRSSFNRPRADSSISGYGTDDDGYQGSIMNRPRRGESNNLFGGRQKVYKIPVKQSGANSEGRSGMGGRALYENDLTLSAFQRIRLEEKKGKQEKKDEETSKEESAGPEAEETVSNISANRTTSSSTASGPSNSWLSTAATSVDEQTSPVQSSNESLASPNMDGHGSGSKPVSSGGMLRNGNSVRSRRLYGQGLAQSVQDQQSSTLYRLESLSRQRAATPELHGLNRSYSRSATNLHDRLHKFAIAESSPSLRPSSPSPSAASSRQQRRESDPKETKQQPLAGAGAVDGSSVRPLSPPVSENEDHSTQLAASVNPEDRGKATAMGLFNKPQTSFDESQFIHRQLQMRQNVPTPPLRRPSPPSAAPSQDGPSRPRGFSTTSSYRSRAESGASSHYSDSRRVVNRSNASTRNTSPVRPVNDTFLANDSSSDSEEDEDRRSTRVSSTTSHERDSTRSAVRSASSANSPISTRESSGRLPEVRLSELADLNTIAEDEQIQPDAPTNEPLPEKPDSPTLGPAGLGLSGLVRTHLRQDSDKSFILPPPSLSSPPSSKQRNVENPSYSPTYRTQTSRIPMSPPRTGWNPKFEKDFAVDTSISTPGIPQHLLCQDPPDFQPSQKWTPGQHLNNREIHPVARPPNDASDVAGRGSFEDEMNIGHRRGSSTETYREREEFARELAERRKKVEEKLKGIAEVESRSTSPAPGYRSSSEHHHHHIKPGNAFSVLKSKPSKSSLQGRPETKKMHPLGFGAGNASTPTLASEDPWREEEERPPFGFGKHSNSSSPHIGLRSKRSMIIGGRSREDSRERGRGPSPSPHRLPSDASGRSKSRCRDRENMGPFGTAGYHNNTDVLASPDNSQDQYSIPSVPSSARPSVEVNDQGDEPCTSAASARFGGGSRPAVASNYFDNPPNPAPTGNSPPIGIPHRPSPIPSFCANTTPPLEDLSSDGTAAPPSAGVGSSAPQRGLTQSGLTKRAVNKSQISEPTFVHSTSSVPVVGLPAGASLHNGMPPPVPPMNPRRRRQTTTHTIFGAFKGEKSESRQQPMFNTEYVEDHSIFSDEDKKIKVKGRLRKMSSEGGNLKQKARPEAAYGPFHPPPPYPPPTFPRQPHHIQMEGGMI
ncbi:hypothetical protein MPDQ_001695 [Monascus purpureus]|uniref:Uncharacterized protein n=1 Tax=Monascus purpureus TaxID=5098 RepID=A0A507QR85_MONPU|nr:hypothetical protein MPDQ_001695 [Monascus purpureus]BDD58156.1 hypothetical protein MAP00_003457 [Monascus purpureus]